MITLLPTRNVMVGLVISALAFFATGYDTLSGHMLTGPINNWVIHTLYVSPISTGWQQLYYESLQSITAMGSDIIFVLIAGLILLDLFKQKQFLPLCYCIFIVLITMAIVHFLKTYIDSPRPIVLYQHDSFPSGHVARASVWCGLLLFLNHINVYRLSRYWCGVLILLPLLVAFSRLGLGFHWLSDVVASYALILFIFLLMAYIVDFTKSRGVRASLR